MAKKGIIIGGIAAAIIVGIVAASASQFGSETVNLDMQRMHGDISTAM